MALVQEFWTVGEASASAATPPRAKDKAISVQPLPISASPVDTSRVQSRTAVAPGETSTSLPGNRMPSDTGSLVSDVSSRAAALRNLGESLRMAQLAEQSLSFVSAQLGKISDALAAGSPDQGYVDAVASGIDSSLDSLPPTARPMVPAAQPQEQSFFAEMSAQSLLPSWERATALPSSSQVSAAQVLVSDTQAHLASSRSELVQAATAVGLVGSSSGVNRPSEAELAALAGALTTPEATAGTHDVAHSSTLRALLP